MKLNLKHETGEAFDALFLICLFQESSQSNLSLKAKDDFKYMKWKRVKAADSLVLYKKLKTKQNKQKFVFKEFETVFSIDLQLLWQIVILSIYAI